jgi:hypothetical protein
MGSWEVESLRETAAELFDQQAVTDGDHAIHPLFIHCSLPSPQPIMGVDNHSPTSSLLSVVELWDSRDKVAYRLLTAAIRVPPQHQHQRQQGRWLVLAAKVLAASSDSPARSLVDCCWVHAALARAVEASSSHCDPPAASADIGESYTGPPTVLETSTNILGTKPTASSDTKERGSGISREDIRIHGDGDSDILMMLVASSAAAMNTSETQDISASSQSSVTASSINMDTVSFYAASDCDTDSYLGGGGSRRVDTDLNNDSDGDSEGEAFEGNRGYQSQSLVSFSRSVRADAAIDSGCFSSVNKRSSAAARRQFLEDTSCRKNIEDDGQCEAEQVINDDDEEVQTTRPDSSKEPLYGNRRRSKKQSRSSSGIGGGHHEQGQRLKRRRSDQHNSAADDASKEHLNRSVARRLHENGSVGSSSTVARREEGETVVYAKCMDGISEAEANSTTTADESPGLTNDTNLFDQNNLSVGHAITSQTDVAAAAAAANGSYHQRLVRGFSKQQQQVAVSSQVSSSTDSHSSNAKPSAFSLTNIQKHRSISNTVSYDQSPKVPPVIGSTTTTKASKPTTVEYRSNTKPLVDHDSDRKPVSPTDNAVNRSSVAAAKNRSSEPAQPRHQYQHRRQSQPQQGRISCPHSDSNSDSDFE